MRVSAIRTGFSVLVAAVLLSACGGRGIVPSQSGAPGSPLGPSVVQHTSPCASASFPWYLHGSCKGFPVTPNGGSVSLRAYKGLGFAFSIGANGPSTGKLPFVAGDATGTGDITGTTTFPLYSQATCFTGTKCPGKTAIYFAIANNGAKPTTVTGNLSFTVTAKSFPGKRCFLAQLVPPASWVPSVATAKGVKNGKVTLTSVGGGRLGFPARMAGYGAVACI